MTAPAHALVQSRAHGPLHAFSAFVHRARAARMAAVLRDLPDHQLEAAGIARDAIGDHARRLVEAG